MEQGAYGTPSLAYTNSAPSQHPVNLGGLDALSSYTKFGMPKRRTGGVAGAFIQTSLAEFTCSRWLTLQPTSAVNYMFRNN